MLNRACAAPWVGSEWPCVARWLIVPCKLEEEREGDEEVERTKELVIDEGRPANKQ